MIPIYHSIIFKNKRSEKNYYHKLYTNGISMYRHYIACSYIFVDITCLTTVYYLELVVFPLYPDKRNIYGFFIEITGGNWIYFIIYLIKYRIFYSNYEIKRLRKLDK